MFKNNYLNSLTVSDGAQQQIESATVFGADLVVARLVPVLDIPFSIFLCDCAVA